MADPYSPPLMPGISNDALASSSNYGAGSSPFFSIANQFLPRNLKDVLKWVRYITIQSPVVTEVLRKLATFPITNFTYSSDDEAVRSKFVAVTKSFQLKQALHNVGFQYFTAGNVFVSVYFPILRSLTCQGCKTEFPYAHTTEFVKFVSYKFQGTCPNCGTKGEWLRKDIKSLAIKDMNVILWDPLNITVNHNPISGKSRYYYNIPNEVVRQVQAGNPIYLESLPWEMIEAIKDKKDFEFAEGKIYHLRNIDTGFSANGISVPPLVSHFGLVFYQASLRKANESIASEFMSPMRVVFPQPQTSNSDPVVAISMRNFASKMEEALIKHKRDKAHVLIAPMPIGYQAISGEGKTLLVAQEIREAEESLLLSLGVSRELLSGTTNWTSSTVGLRMLKNTLESYVGQVSELLEWISDSVSNYLSIGTCHMGLTPFQLTDDEALKSLMMGLASSGQISMTTVYESMGKSYDEEIARMIEDAKALARLEVRKEYEVGQAKYLEGMEIKKEGTDASYLETLSAAQQMVAQLRQAAPDMAQMVLDQLAATDYGKYALVMHLLLKPQDPLNPQGNPEDPNQPGQQGQGQGQAEPGQSADQKGQSPAASSGSEKSPPQPETVA